MANKTDTEKATAMDTVILILSLLILAAGIYGFYYFEGQSTPVRVLGLLAALAVAALVLSKSVKGANLFRFIKEADIERRKVVWPTRQETVQTTILVLVVTIIISILTFLIDMGIGKVVRLLIG